MNRRRLLISLAWAVAAIAAAGALYVWLALHWSYSEGERAGFVQKLSKKGWVCKTWEGELLLATMPGAVPEKFAFTVRDERVAAQLRQLAGRRVLLTYEQHRGLPTSCFGDTDYFATGAVPAN